MPGDARGQPGLRDVEAGAQSDEVPHHPLPRVQGALCSLHPLQGADEDKYVTSLITSDVAFMGHVKLILKSDNEAALLTLVRAALQEIRCTVPDVTHATSEEAAAYESPSNGGTECGIL